jgi:hypothetical protein
MAAKRKLAPVQFEAESRRHFKGKPESFVKRSDFKVRIKMRPAVDPKEFFPEVTIGRLPLCVIE